MFSVSSHKMKFFVVDNGVTQVRHEIEAHNDTIGPIGTDDPYGHDGPCPLGDYGLGLPEAAATRNGDGTVTSNDPTDIAYGCWFTPLVDIGGLWAAHGRSGIGVHGGGSASPTPFAIQQGWYPTEGCIRLQNEDNENVFVPFVRYLLLKSAKLTLTVAA